MVLPVCDFIPCILFTHFEAEKITPTNQSSSHKTRLNDLSCGIKIWTDLYSVLSQSTRLTDEQTYRQTDSFLGGCISSRHRTLEFTPRTPFGPFLLRATDIPTLPLAKESMDASRAYNPARV